MFKKQLPLLLTLMSVGLFVLGMLVHSQIKVVELEPEVFAQKQLEEYKKAEVICGEDNVSEKYYCEKEEGCKSANELSKVRYECADLSWAALSEASRSAIMERRLQQEVDRYCEDQRLYGKKEVNNFNMYHN